MPAKAWSNKFWWRWIVANSLAEFIGLGSVAAIGLGSVAAAGYFVMSILGEPQGIFPALLFATIFITLGAFEGLVVGYAQTKVLQQQLPTLRGWIRATVVGAVIAWVLGMLPSTVMNLANVSETSPPPEISEWLRLLFAAGLGLITGPILAFFQWRCLRHYVRTRSRWWLPANALAWAAGMPVIFAGAHVAAISTIHLVIIFAVGLSLLLAGTIVGAIHGRILVWILNEAVQSPAANS